MKDINSSRLELLYPDFSRRIALILKDMKEIGFNCVIQEGLRSKEKQEYLYSLGRTLPGKVVTNRTVGYHNMGLAVDIIEAGDKPYPPVESLFWKRLEDFATKHGVRSGRSFKSILDCPHIQANYNIPEDFLFSIFKDYNILGLWTYLDKVNNQSNALWAGKLPTVMAMLNGKFTR